MSAVATQYEAIIGIEIHVQMHTASKMFCGCKIEYGAAPNTLTCPVCQAQPGALPVLNRRAVEFGIRVGIALNCEIGELMHFDRKNYFYPDLPKGYQITQMDAPLNGPGWLEIPLLDETTGKPKRIGITRAHLEEDTGKSIHMDEFSLLDFNRAGTPLIEIVSDPDLRSSAEAYLYLTTLKRNLSYLGISNLSMEKGALRCDMNVSLRPLGTSGLPDYKVEVKNLNSFGNAREAIEFEIARQSKMLDAGQRPSAETRMWNEAAGETVSMRSKEDANDYRFFPEPDLPQIHIDPEWVASIRAAMPEMPSQRLNRMTGEYGIDSEKAEHIIDDPASADFLEACVALQASPKKVANWLVGGIAKAANERNCSFAEIAITPAQLVELIALLDAGKLNNITANEVLEELIGSKESALAVAKRLNKLIGDDDGAVAAVVDDVLAEFTKAASELREGKEQALGFLIGQCMRKLKGRANPKQLGPIIQARVADDK